MVRSVAPVIYSQSVSPRTRCHSPFVHLFPSSLFLYVAATKETLWEDSFRKFFLAAMKIIPPLPPIPTHSPTAFAALVLHFAYMTAALSTPPTSLRHIPDVFGGVTRPLSPCTCLPGMQGCEGRVSHHRDQRPRARQDDRRSQVQQLTLKLRLSFDLFSRNAARSSRVALAHPCETLCLVSMSVLSSSACTVLQYC